VDNKKLKALREMAGCRAAIGTLQETVPRRTSEFSDLTAQALALDSELAKSVSELLNHIDSTDAAHSKLIFMLVMRQGELRMVIDDLAPDHPILTRVPRLWINQLVDHLREGLIEIAELDGNAAAIARARLDTQPLPEDADES